ncbi:hypothetical protein [Agrobacterium fabrum]|uniref:hypothetical protein n=1 Tax=Agrobacterium fabrum TaxID=1176649 RepID=UPI002157B48B|nr:hypothetical protein [Agrobacterium fabrum]MCR6727822.1 hypothetical protein [Agrobacterium fabrum]
MRAKNPPQLTKRQHIIPRKSITRFCNQSGFVRAIRKDNKPLLLKPANPFFCAMRLWEERSENGHKPIEDNFQEIADAVCNAELTILDQRQSDQVTAMFALWTVRSRLVGANATRSGLQAMPGMKGLPPHANISGWSSDDRDQLEKANYVVCDPDGSIPGRMFAWPRMQREINWICSRSSGMTWGVLHAGEGEFVMPDRYQQTWILPLSPTILLAAGRGPETLSADAVARVNSISMSEHRQWILEKP